MRAIIVKHAQVADLRRLPATWALTMYGSSLRFSTESVRRMRAWTDWAGANWLWGVCAVMIGRFKTAFGLTQLQEHSRRSYICANGIIIAYQVLRSSFATLVAGEVQTRVTESRSAIEMMRPRMHGSSTIDGSTYPR